MFIALINFFDFRLLNVRVPPCVVVSTTTTTTTRKKATLRVPTISLKFQVL